MTSQLADRVDGALCLEPQFCLEPMPHGDCWRACLATITGIPARGMPNFMHQPGIHGADEGRVLARDWLRLRGLSIFSTYCSAGWSLEKVIQVFSKENLGVPIILSGVCDAVSDKHHAVVIMDGQIVHDPSGAGLVGPDPCRCGEPTCDLAWWWLDVVSVGRQPPLTAALRIRAIGAKP